MSNRAAKEKTLSEMVNLLNALECKLYLLDALDSDVTVTDCMDLSDQLVSMTKSLDMLTKSVLRANDINGVDNDLLS